MSILPGTPNLSSNIPDNEGLNLKSEDLYKYANSLTGMFFYKGIECRWKHFPP